MLACIPGINNHYSNSILGHFYSSDFFFFLIDGMHSYSAFTILKVVMVSRLYTYCEMLLYFVYNLWKKMRSVQKNNFLIYSLRKKKVNFLTSLNYWTRYFETCISNVTNSLHRSHVYLIAKVPNIIKLI